MVWASWLITLSPCIQMFVSISWEITSSIFNLYEVQAYHLIKTKLKLQQNKTALWIATVYREDSTHVLQLMQQETYSLTFK